MKFFEKLKPVSDWGDLILRLVVGLIFIVAGYGKLFGAMSGGGFAGMLTGLGVPAAGFFAILVPIIELVGGILIFLGVFASIPAALLIIVMLVAIFTVHLKDGFGGMAYQLVLIGALLRYVGTSGKYSVCSVIKNKSKGK